MLNRYWNNRLSVLLRPELSVCLFQIHIQHLQHYQIQRAELSIRYLIKTYLHNLNRCTLLILYQKIIWSHNWDMTCSTISFDTYSCPVFVIIQDANSLYSDRIKGADCLECNCYLKFFSTFTLTNSIISFTNQSIPENNKTLSGLKGA